MVDLLRKLNDYLDKKIPTETLENCINQMSEENKKDAILFLIGYIEGLRET